MQLERRSEYFIHQQLFIIQIIIHLRLFLYVRIILDDSSGWSERVLSLSWADVERGEEGSKRIPNLSETLGHRPRINIDRPVRLAWRDRCCRWQGKEKWCYDTECEWFVEPRTGRHFSFPLIGFAHYRCTTRRLAINSFLSFRGNSYRIILNIIFFKIVPSKILARAESIRSNSWKTRI